MIVENSDEGKNREHNECSHGQIERVARGYPDRELTDSDVDTVLAMVWVTHSCYKSPIEPQMKAGGSHFPAVSSLAAQHFSV
jgi:hypothetical protein